MGWKSHDSWVYISNLKKIPWKIRFLAFPPTFEEKYWPNVLKSSTNYFSHYTYHYMFFNYYRQNLRHHISDLFDVSILVNYNNPA